MLFGSKFKIHKDDREVLYRLCSYFIADKEVCYRYRMDPDKGILLTGPVGCGKTSPRRLLKHLVPHRKPYDVITSRNIVFGFNNVGYPILEQYGDHRHYCFDDLGVEPTGRHFGKDCNVLGEILLSRYDLYLKYKVRIHATTNLNAQELEDRYGNRVRSRMRELFNLVAFGPNARDKRR